MPRRAFAVVSKSGPPPRTKHFMGVPPVKEGAPDNRVEMGVARVLILEELEDGFFMIFRFTSKGEFVGDTWHETREAAHDQAEFEYGGRLGEWSVMSEMLSEDEQVVVALKAPKALP